MCCTAAYVHQVKHDWYNTIHPCVPGHEIIGRVVAAGSAVTKFKTGNMMGVGGLHGGRLRHVQFLP